MNFSGCCTQEKVGARPRMGCEGRRVTNVGHNLGLSVSKAIPPTMVPVR